MHSSAYSRQNGSARKVLIVFAVAIGGAFSMLLPLPMHAAPPSDLSLELQLDTQALTNDMNSIQMRLCSSQGSSMLCNNFRAFQQTYASRLSAILRERSRRQQTNPTYQQQMSAHVGNTFTIILPVNPSTGYQWQVSYDHRLLSIQSSNITTPPSSYVGVAGNQAFVFKALVRGNSDVIFRSIRPWQPSESVDTRRYRITIQ